ncbi:energy transducer TonB [Pontibacter indicus]|uniref:TonB family C-terminal domain-containing protein n=1 Tax=Pontibacter indicus TaxID=1317125 RepID=A0A1R3XGS4_9BACT|nr:energy transducer TonB [Pontibacter indicus]SIT89368.1 TonB family C-terminal domain-containing protein [Pontibacter indicus]
MKQLYIQLIAVILLLHGQAAIAQITETRYLNELSQEVGAEEATFKEVIERDEAGGSVRTRYSVKDNSKLRQFSYKEGSDGKSRRHGTHYEWYPEGQLKLEINYRNDSLTGPHTRWYKNGQVHVSQHYHGYQLVDTLKSYYESGALRRLEVYSKGKMQKGRVYSESGREIKYTPMEVQPEFPGGEMKMMNWLAQNVRYPAEAQKAGAQGLVIISYLVDTSGRISNIEVLRGFHPAGDTEAIRVVKQMPRFKPGTIEGEPIDMTYILPIRFTIH